MYVGIDCGIDQQCADRFYEANDLAGQDVREECVVKDRELLADGTYPRCHRLKTLLLLASDLEG
jgi:hypothetical protein